MIRCQIYIKMHKKYCCQDAVCFSQSESRAGTFTAHRIAVFFSSESYLPSILWPFREITYFLFCFYAYPMCASTCQIFSVAKFRLLLSVLASYNYWIICLQFDSYKECTEYPHHFTLSACDEIVNNRWQRNMPKVFIFQLYGLTCPC